MTRRINAAGLAHIKKWEGCSLSAYRDVANVLTIGYGSTGSHVKPGMRITEFQAESLLKNDLDRFERAVEKLVKVPLTDNQFAALVSFSFNVGVGALQSSTLLKKLNAGDYASVPSELMKWVNAGGKKVNGLINRRRADGALFGTKGITLKPNATKASSPQTPQMGITPKTGLLSALFAAILAIFKRN